MSDVPSLRACQVAVAMLWERGYALTPPRPSSQPSSPTAQDVSLETADTTHGNAADRFDAARQLIGALGVSRAKGGWARSMAQGATVGLGAEVEPGTGFVHIAAGSGAAEAWGPEAGTPWGGHPTAVAVTGRLDESIWLLATPPSMHKIGKVHVTQLLAAAAAARVRRCFIVVPRAKMFNHYCAQAVRAAAEAHPLAPVAVEVAGHAGLPHMLTQHVDMPPVHMLPREAALRLVARMARAVPGSDPAHPAAGLPRMATSDPLARWYALPDGIVVHYVQQLGHGTMPLWMARRVTQASDAQRKRKSAHALPAPDDMWRVFEP